MHLFIFILRNELLKISFFNYKWLHAVIASERSLRSCRSKPSISSFTVVLKNRTKSRIIKTLAGNSFNHSFNVKCQFELSFDSFDKCCFANSPTFVDKTTQGNKRIDCKLIKKLTVFIVFSKVSSIAVFSFFFYLRGVVQKNIHVKNSDFLVRDFLINLIFSIILEVVNCCWMIKKRTSQNGNHVIETDASSGSLISPFIKILKLKLLVFGQNTPLFVEKLIKIISTSFSHCYLSYLI